MMRNHRDRFEAERLKHELMGMGIGKESPLARLTPTRAVLIMGTIVGVLALVAVFTGSSGMISAEAYADNVRSLSESIRLEDRHRIPMEIQQECLGGNSESCIKHQTNVGAQADRMEDHIADLFRFDAPSIAANFNAEYTLALQAIESCYRRERELLKSQDFSGFAIATTETSKALEHERFLIDQLNRDFPNKTVIQNPS